MSLRVKGCVVRVLEQAWDHAVALRLCEHSGLRQAAAGPLADHRRRIVMELLQQRGNSFIRAQIRQAFHRPVTNFGVRILKLGD